MILIGHGENDFAKVSKNLAKILNTSAKSFFCMTKNKPKKIRCQLRRTFSSSDESTSLFHLSAERKNVAILELFMNFLQCLCRSYGLFYYIFEL